ncbi:MAG: hypothetical protein KTR30_06965 [Saprospiraceae bacterium]|nr:hypothetical protein [Saprospiraceae bacterium]
MNLFYKCLRLLPFAILITFLSSCEDVPDVLSYVGEDFYRFTSPASSIAENSPEPVSIPVIFSSKAGATASGTIQFEVSGGQEGVDYTLVNADKSLSISSGNGFQGLIQIQPLDNTESSDTDIELTITLLNGSNGTIGFPGPDNTNTASHTLTIIDDDCPVIPIGGTYASVSRGTSTDGCCTDEITGFQAEITITDNGDGSFTLNDFSGGIYLEWYDVYNITSQDDSPATFTITDPVNNTISFVEGSMEPFGRAVNATGTYDPCTGNLSYAWESGWGDEGDVSLSVK